MVLLILIAIELILKSVENVVYLGLSEEAKERYKGNKAKPKEWAWGKNIWKKITGNKPLEQEGEIILDHNYDGIRELNNKLPPWWVYMFYATIIFGVVYMVRFHIFNDYNQDLEYDREVAQAQLEIEAYKKTAKDLVDASTVELLIEASDLNAGKAIFETNCVACHMVDGGGGIGPNLTDDHYILGGGIKNVFNTISEGGRDGKGGMEPEPTAVGNCPGGQLCGEHTGNHGGQSESCRGRNLGRVNSGRRIVFIPIRRSRDMDVRFFMASTGFFVFGSKTKRSLRS